MLCYVVLVLVLVIFVSFLSCEVVRAASVLLNINVNVPQSYHHMYLSF